MAALHAGLASGLDSVFWIGKLFAAATMAASWRLPGASENRPQTQ